MPFRAYLVCPCSAMHFERKFSDNVGGVLPKVQSDRVLDFLWSIDRQPKLNPLFKLLLVSG